MKKIFGFLIIFSILFITTVINAKEAPEEYTIKKGDTLWDISETKFEDAFLWPNLWRVNPQIKNPDLIYPGQIIKIPSKEDLLRLPAMVEEKPHIIAAPAAVTEEKPVAEIPKKYIIDKERYFSSGWIDEYSPIGKIMASPGDHTTFGKYDPVYLESSQKISVGDRFFAIRKIKKVNHPKTGKYLGQQIRVTGILEVIGMDGRNFDVPKAKITDSFENLQIGDGLLPYAEMELPVAPDIPRTPIIRGYIVESYMNTGIISKGDIIYLDMGENDGIETGDIFSALFETPVERSIGKIQVFSVKPTTSVALVLKSDQEITVGDMWGNR